MAGVLRTWHLSLGSVDAVMVCRSDHCTGRLDDCTGRCEGRVGWRMDSRGGCPEGE